MIGFELIGWQEYRVFLGNWPGATVGKVLLVAPADWVFTGGGVIAHGQTKREAAYRGLYMNEYKGGVI